MHFQILSIKYFSPMELSYVCEILLFFCQPKNDKANLKCEGRKQEAICQGLIDSRLFCLKVGSVNVGARKWTPAQSERLMGSNLKK